MNKSKMILLIVGGAVLLIAMMLISTYNGLVKINEEVEAKWSAVETDLQRRNDLIPNLVSTVQGYAEHEAEVYESITDARAKMSGAMTPEEAAAADSELSAALGRLLAISESNPELKANENFIQLQDELAGTENRIAVSRKDYNEQAKSYNTEVKSFPKNIIAGMFGFDEKEYFEAVEGAENAPEVNFE